MAYYRSKPALERHPLHIELVAARFGVSPRRLDAGARVLELGCGAGDNILALAYSYRDAYFCGIDSSEEAIAEARRGGDALGLSNVDFVNSDFKEVNAHGLIANGYLEKGRIVQGQVGSGRIASDTSDIDASESNQADRGDGKNNHYDYIICHGVYSWVSQDVQKVLRQVIARYLMPSGVCYLSFNCLPGITPRLTLRRIIKSLWSQAERDYGGDAHRLGVIPVSFARQQMQVLLGGIEQRADLYGNELHRELRELIGQSDEFWEVDLLGNDNNPSYLDDVIGDFADVGLSYIADAKPARNRRDRLVGTLLGGIESGDGGAGDRQPVTQPLGMSVGMSMSNDVVLDDLLSPLGFRAALFTPTNGQRRVAVRGMEKLPYIQNLFISSKLVKVSEVAHDLKPERGVAIYCDPKGREIKVRDKVVGLALDVLAEKFPLAVRFSELVEIVESLIGVKLDTAAIGILEMFVESKFSMGQIDCHLQPPHCVNTVSDYPEVFAPSRYQIARFGWGTNTRHEYAQFDEFERTVVPLFTGLTHVSELLERVEELAVTATPNSQQAHRAEHVERVKQEYVRRSGNLLLRLAEEGFLVR